jgi:CelD/BcsL family acetyltransferase involved in cellulose biosynthesis
MGVEVLEGSNLPSWLRKPWEELRLAVAARGMTAGPFLSFDWTAVYARALGARVGVPRIFLVWRGDRLVAALPLVAERRSLAHAPARILRSLSDDHSQRWDALVTDREAAAALVTWLLADESWDALELRDAPARADTGVDLITAAARNASCIVGEWPSQSSPYLALPASPDKVLAGLDAKFRANLRRRARRLAEEVGPVALERITDLAGAQEALGEAFRLEAAGWKGDEGTAVLCDPALEETYRGLAAALARGGSLALTFLKAGDRRVAMHFAAVEGGVYFLFKVGSDATLARHGLGHLLVAEVARDLVGRGVSELDFLGDTADWKRSWTKAERAHTWRYVFRPTVRGRLLAAWKLAAVPTLKRLGEGLQRMSSGLSRP